MTAAEVRALQVLFGNGSGLGVLRSWCAAFHRAGFVLNLGIAWPEVVERVLVAVEGSFHDALLAHWICVVQFKSGRFGWLQVRPVGRQGWNGSVMSFSAKHDTLAGLVGLIHPGGTDRLEAAGYCLTHEDCLENEALARACGEARREKLAS